MVDDKLKKYIEDNIFPIYENNDWGHSLEHINYVIDRSIKFASTLSNINYDMVYTVAAYHDIGHYIDAKNHEKISSEILLNDEALKDFFNSEQINIMAEAVYDHRSNMKGEPRSIYGKIVSSADRNTIIDVSLKRTYEYRLFHCPNDSIEYVIENSRQHILDKFGKNGYAKEKMYFEDDDYKVFLQNISNLAENIDLFKKKYCEINNIKLTEMKRLSKNGGFIWRRTI